MLFSGGRLIDLFFSLFLLGGWVKVQVPQPTPALPGFDLIPAEVDRDAVKPSGELGFLLVCVRSLPGLQKHLLRDVL